jgi:hypothetical protein
MFTGRNRKKVVIFWLLWLAAACTPRHQAIPTATPFAIEKPTQTSVATRTPAASSEYYSPELKLRLSYPAHWSFLDGDPGSEHYSGSDGFFRLSTIASGGMSLDELTQAEANHALQPFGSQPEIATIQVGGTEGRRITPSADQPRIDDTDQAWGEVLVPFPLPVMVNGFLADYAILQADLKHLDSLAGSLQFDPLASGQKLYAATSDTPAAGICQLVTEAVYVMTVSPDMPSPRCLQISQDAMIGFNNQSGAPLTARLGGYEFPLPENVDVIFNVPVGGYLAPGVHQLDTGGMGSAPEIWVLEHP